MSDLRGRIGAEVAVCAACGFVQPLAMRDPMRTDGDRASGRCPACDELAWIDPLHEGAQQMLIDLDAQARRAGGRRERPSRWRWPLRTPSSAGADGIVHAQGELLRAPITGRPCVAYEIAARVDDDDRGEDGTWSLLEQASTALSVGGIDRGADQVQIVAHARTLVDETSDATADLLVRRGLLPADAPYVYETIVAPGDAVRLRMRDGIAELHVHGVRRPRSPWIVRSLGVFGRRACSIWLVLTAIAATLPYAMLPSSGIKQAIGLFIVAGFLSLVLPVLAWWGLHVLDTRAPSSALPARLVLVAATVPIWLRLLP